MNSVKNQRLAKIRSAFFQLSRTLSKLQISDDDEIEEVRKLASDIEGNMDNFRMLKKEERYKSAYKKRVEKDGIEKSFEEPPPERNEKA